MNKKLVDYSELLISHKLGELSYRLRSYIVRKTWKPSNNKTKLTISLCLISILLCGEVASWADPKLKKWNFDSEVAGTLPKNFIVGTLVDGRSAGKWQVINMKTSMSFIDKLDQRDQTRIRKVLQKSEVPSAPHVFAQLKNRGYFTDFNVVLVGGTKATDIDLKVSFLAIAGRGDMGGGLIWRAQDNKNYYIVRANPLEQNIRFYRVVNGVRHKLKNFNHIISIKAWQTIRVVARGNNFKIYFNSQLVIDINDETFQTDGKIGLWTKADALTYFDDLQLSIED